jgi:hypothetical protein
MNKIVEIFKAWGISFNPNDSQTDLAIKRLEICNSCDSKKDTPYIHCGECFCALQAKIYTPKLGACPRGKWTAVEMEWSNKQNKERYNQIK